MKRELVVRFTPPYSNKPKDIPVDDPREASQLAAWLENLGATDLHVNVVTLRVVEEPWQ